MNNETTTPSTDAEIYNKKLDEYKRVIINQNEEIRQLTEENRQLKQKSAKQGSGGKSYGWILTLLVGLLCGGGVGAGFYYVMQQNNETARLEMEKARGYINEKDSLLTTKGVKISDMNDRISLLKDSLHRMSAYYDTLKTQYNGLRSSVSETLPMIVKRVDIANTDAEGNIISDYGQKLYSNVSMFLRPRIEYAGMKPGTSINLVVKITGPMDYTYSDSFVLGGDNSLVRIKGCGSSTPGHWKSGAYKMEFWNEDKVCLYRKTFIIDPKAPVAEPAN